MVVCCRAFYAIFFSGGRRKKKKKRFFITFLRVFNGDFAKLQRGTKGAGRASS